MPSSRCICTMGRIWLLFNTCFTYSHSGFFFYIAERVEQGFDLLTACWASLITLCGVGYGDKNFSTTFGRLCAGTTAVSGTMLLSILIGTMAELLTKLTNTQSTCADMVRCYSLENRIRVAAASIIQLCYRHYRAIRRPAEEGMAHSYLDYLVLKRKVTVRVHAACVELRRMKFNHEEIEGRICGDESSSVQSMQLQVLSALQRLNKVEGQVNRFATVMGDNSLKQVKESVEVADDMVPKTEADVLAQIDKMSNKLYEKLDQAEYLMNPPSASWLGWW
eukprot:gnl/Hemi2/22559_TR7528_c0_g1_i1.p1 gnl/Hemi2/22559_TR7528_c0_g1~~gnl/Hemi2/22559_TR7528_c0_g1_i1.p1  ORF type:complete len:278 (-),score=50.21 gnl/Hemi2/22559_TR7528_c0_g1_i1:127-960(-)